MLLLYKHQTTTSDVLALSSTSRNMRTLFLDNARSIILSAVCKNSDLLAAAGTLVETISEVAKRPGLGLHSIKQRHPYRLVYTFHRIACQDCIRYFSNMIVNCWQNDIYMSLSPSWSSLPDPSHTSNLSVLPHATGLTTLYRPRKNTILLHQDPKPHIKEPQSTNFTYPKPSNSHWHIPLQIGL